MLAKFSSINWTIFKEELKIVRILNSLIVELELVNYEQQINSRLEKAKEKKVGLLSSFGNQYLKFENILY